MPSIPKATQPPGISMFLLVPKCSNTGRVFLFFMMILFTCCQAKVTATDESNTQPPMSNMLSLRGASSDPKTVTSKHHTNPNELLGDRERLKYRRYKSLTGSISLDMIVSYCRDSMDKIYEYAELLGVRYLYLYSKCDYEIPLTNRKFKVREVIHSKLPNVGREGHTYLTHMMRTDVEFGDWNLFLQGELEAPVESIVVALLDMAEHRLGGKQYDFVEFSQYHVKRIRSRCYRKIYFPCPPPGMEMKQVCDWHNQFRFDDRYSCDEAPVSFRGEFLMTRELIKKQNHTTLTGMVNLLSEENNPMIGMYLERDWISILGATHWDVIDPNIRNHP